jgi:hypothetical protein
MKLTGKRAAITALAIAAFAALSDSGCSSSEGDHSDHARKYSCSMHSDVVQDKAGKCPKCGMDLTEKR